MLMHEFLLSYLLIAASSKASEENKYFSIEKKRDGRQASRAWAFHKFM